MLCYKDINLFGQLMIVAPIRSCISYIIYILSPYILINLIKIENELNMSHIHLRIFIFFYNTCSALHLSHCYMLLYLLHSTRVFFFTLKLLLLFFYCCCFLSIKFSSLCPVCSLLAFTSFCVCTSYNMIIIMNNLCD